MANQVNNNVEHIQNPHDKAFKDIMSDMNVARDFLTAHLPKDVLARVDLGKLEPQDRKFLDGIYNEREVDILYKTTLEGEDCYIYLAVEHQSTFDETMPLRILRYSVEIMERHVKLTGKNRIPLVLPLVVYHGTKNWAASTDIRDMVDAPRDMIDRYFLKPFTLIDLSKMADGDLKKHAVAGVMELIFKHIYDRDMLSALHMMASALREAVRRGGSGRRAVMVMLEYVMREGQIDDKDKFRDIISNEIAPDVEDELMTIIQQAEYSVLRDTAIRLLAKGIDDEVVSETTKIPLEKVRQLRDEEANEKPH